MIILIGSLTSGLISYEHRLVSVHKALQECRKTTNRLKADNKEIRLKLTQVVDALDTCNKTFTKTQKDCAKMQHSCSEMMGRCKMIINRKLNCRRPSYISRRL